MVAPMFILTRTFAISALLVGALPATYAAPVPAPSILDTVVIFAARQKHDAPPSPPSVAFPPALVAQLAKRSCRQQGCLRAEVAPDADPVSARSDLGDASSPIAHVAAIAGEAALSPAESGVSNLGSELPSEARSEAKRSCRQAGCLRDSELASRTPASTSETRRALGDFEIIVDTQEELVGDVVDVLHNLGAEVDMAIDPKANPKRSCRQAGCLREPAAESR